VAGGSAGCGRRRGTAAAGLLALLLAAGLAPCAVQAGDDSTDVAPWTQAQPGAASDAVPPAPQPAATAGGAASTDTAEIVLTGGSLKGAASGSGAASVQARVTNSGGRKLLGVRIGAYYDTIDALPAPDARWRLHEFLFEPPLAPGGASDVGFTDQDAAAYVLLRIVYARFALAVAADGGAPAPAGEELADRGGVQYIAARDLAAALGAKLRLDARKLVTLSRAGAGGHGALSLSYTAGQAALSIGGAARTWAHLPYEQGGRGYLPLQEACGLLGYDADYDEGVNVLTLTKRQ
jgi:hypothetical protein